MRQASSALAKAIEEALERRRVAVEQLPTQIPGERIAPAAPGSPGVVDLDDVATLPIAVGDIDATGTPGSSTFLRGDGSWATPAGGGFANPMTTLGDLIVGGASGTPTRLARGATGQRLTVAADGTLVWETPAAEGLVDQGTATFLDFAEAAAPATPASGKVRLYAKSDGAIYQKDDAGVETGLAGGGSSGSGGSNGMAAFTAPPATGWSWVNQGSATVSTTATTITLTDPANSATSYRLYARTAPATPYVITAAIYASPLLVEFNSFGIGWRQSSNGRLILGRVLGIGASTQLALLQASSPTGDVANYVSPGYRPPALSWFRIADNGTNRTFSLSPDGVEWTQIHSVGRTDWLTADQVCFFVSSRNGTYPITARLVSWQEA